MNFASCMKSRMRLHLLAVEALQEFDKSVDRATPKVFHLVVDDADLLMELVSQYVQKVLDEDMNGGGIGLRPVDKTGGDVVAGGAGQSSFDALTIDAPSSAPQSQTPAEMPVGGGHARRETHFPSASPSIPSRHEAYTVVREHERVLPSKKAFAAQQEQWRPADIAPSTKTETKPKVPYVAPKERVSAQAQLRAKNIVAATILDTLIVRGKSIGKWRKEEALELAEKLDWDGKVLKAFADPLPPGALVEEYITVREAENIMKTLEANRAA